MKKFLLGILTAVCTVSAAIGFTGCIDIGNIGKKDKTETGWGNEYTVATAYSKAVELGYDKSLDDFIAAISGKDGKDGVGIKDVKFNEEGSMVVVLTDDSTKDLGKIPYCKHNFSEWETVLEATCTSLGYSVRECDICGYIEYNFAEAKGHIWIVGEEFFGKILKTCNVCHATQIEEIPLSGDDDNNNFDDNKPTDSSTNRNFILPVDNAEVTYSYEFRYDTTLDRYSVHQGMDFKCEAGANVKAALDGTVTKVVRDHILNENYVRITHSNGMTTTYKYIVAIEGLNEGDIVKQGDIIGTIAEAGGMEMNQGEHLHFEVAVNGKTTDPSKYFDISDK